MDAARMHLPVPIGEIPERFNVSAHAFRRSGVAIYVEDAEFVQIPQDSPALKLTVLVNLADSKSSQRWIVRIPIAIEDLDPDITQQAFVAIFRANLDEWWFVKDAEPDFAKWGTRL